jgi:hypothetical protein
VITSELLEAHLACLTKCYLRSIGEVGSGNAYAAWDKARGESYRCEGIGRLAASSSQDLAFGRIDASRLKKARWQLALDQVFRAEDLEASIHAVQRLSMGGNTTVYGPRIRSQSAEGRYSRGSESLSKMSEKMAQKRTFGIKNSAGSYFW